jgi:hypothetical protein
MSVEDKAALLRYVLRNLNIDAYNIFNTSAQTHRVLRAAAMTTWREAVAAA